NAEGTDDGEGVKCFSCGFAVATNLSTLLKNIVRIVAESIPSQLKMIIFNKCLLHIALISIYINYCVGEGEYEYEYYDYEYEPDDKSQRSDPGVEISKCSAQFEEGIQYHRTCLTEQKKKLKLDESADPVTIDKLCKLFGLSINCTIDGQKILQNCPDFEKKQLKNHIGGFREYYDYQCVKGHFKIETSINVVNCEVETKEARDACNDRYNYEADKFMPNPGFTQKFDPEMWTPADCEKKFKWADCIIRVYGKCKDPLAKQHHGTLLLKVLQSYPSCNETLGSEFINYSLDRAAYPTISHFVLFVLPIILYKFKYDK
uniref:Uncharacterized protein n=1 Tax=Strigamia maritima TaxID=126957 RepID=T1IND9_STRMM